jgi:hypothetical protein
MNLDAITIDELHRFCQDESNPESLREYAAIKARAMEARIAGRIRAALKWEQSLDRIYDSLPDDLRW